jgi:hypothetical protein
LKSHQTHPKQNYRGMSFIFENSSKSRLLSIRGRLGTETFEYFDLARAERKAASKKNVVEKPVVMAVLDKVTEEVPLATHVISHAR